jgi:hypothetical protein
MTDATSQTPITHKSRHQADCREFCAYFALIFLATLPLAVLTWALRAVRHLELPEKGPVARAWNQARIITPQIFRA